MRTQQSQLAAPKGANVEGRELQPQRVPEHSSGSELESGERLEATVSYVGGGGKYGGTGSPVGECLSDRFYLCQLLFQLMVKNAGVRVFL